jgi:hypothetical protein
MLDAPMRPGHLEPLQRREAILPQTRAEMPCQLTLNDAVDKRLRVHLQQCASFPPDDALACRGESACVHLHQPNAPNNFPVVADGLTALGLNRAMLQQLCGELLMQGRASDVTNVAVTVRIRP